MQREDIIHFCPRRSGTDKAEWFFGFQRHKVAVMNMHQWLTNFEQACFLLMVSQAPEKVRGFPIHASSDSNVSRKYVHSFSQCSGRSAGYCSFNFA